MAIKLDLATVLLLHQCSFLVGAVCFLYARWQSRGGEGLGILASGFFSLALASTLAGLGERELLPRSVWTFASCTGGFVGYALFWIGMRRLSSGKQRRMDWWVLAIPALALVIAAVTGFHLDNEARGSVSNALACMFLVASAVSIVVDRVLEPLPARIVLAGAIILASLLALLVVVGLLLPDIAPMTPRWAFFLRIICHFAIALFVIILVKERAEAELRHAADTDMLTGVGNRRWFMAQLPTVMLEGNALLMIDLDFFKQINDRFGHDMGDLVLVKFAEAISRNLRTGDSFARLGGEEFGVYLPKTGAIDAMAIAERMLDVVRELVVENAGKRVRLTVSIGVAVSRDRYSPWSSVMNTADAALYAAKEAGRDRAVLSKQMQVSAA